MLKRRLIPYIVGAFIVVSLSISYVGYRTYQNHGEFKRFISESDRIAGSNSEHKGKNPENEAPNLLDQSPVKVRYTEASEIGEPSSASSDSSHVIPYEGPLVPQFIETPDGKISVVYTPPHMPIKAGAAIPEPPTDTIDTIQQFWDELKRTGDGWFTVNPEDVPDHVPESEREAYMEKIVEAAEMGISVEELERRLASGELIIEYAPLTPEDEKMLDAHFAGIERRSLPDGEHKPLSHAATNTVSEASFPVDTDPVSEGSIPHDTDAAQVRPDVLSALDNSMVKPISPQSVADIEKQFSSEGIKAELTEGLSSDRFNKAQQLIDQYGTEEGLRRLREMDPEAARRFESDKSRPGREQRNPPTRDTSEDAASTQ